MSKDFLYGMGIGGLISRLRCISYVDFNIERGMRGRIGDRGLCLGLFGINGFSYSLSYVCVYIY